MQLSIDAKPSLWISGRGYVRDVQELYDHAITAAYDELEMRAAEEHGDVPEYSLEVVAEKIGFASDVRRKQVSSAMSKEGRGASGKKRITGFDLRRKARLQEILSGTRLEVRTSRTDAEDTSLKRLKSKAVERWQMMDQVSQGTEPSERMELFEEDMKMP